jgi:hypothetical protein
LCFVCVALFFLKGVCAMSRYVAFVGSRSLPESIRPRVAAAVSAYGRKGWSIAVGCCVGADAFAATAAQAAHLPVSLFAVGAADGSGFWAGSAPLSSFPADVRWLAGGSLSVPLSARMPRRSDAVIVASAGVVAFFFGPSKGT